jgi:hypothetical protein
MVSGLAKEVVVRMTSRKALELGLYFALMPVTSTYWRRWEYPGGMPRTMDLHYLQSTLKAHLRSSADLWSPT